MACSARLVMTVIVGLTRALVSQSWLTPQTSFPMNADGSSVRVTAHFADLENASTLLLSGDGATLYVGARNAILSLDVTNPGTLSLKQKLDWIPSEEDIQRCLQRSNEKDAPNCHNYIRVLQPLSATQMYACGTHALQPHDTIIETEMLTQSRKPAAAKGHCPYSAVERIAAVSADGEVYVATTSDYRGTTASVSRFLSKGGVDLSLDNPLKIIEPTFVKSSAIPGEEKVYFFFTETGSEYHFLNKLIVSRVAQICKGDTGGKLMLQKRWTTFAKAHLVCQQGNDLPYTILHDIVHIPSLDQDSSDDVTFYGVFSSQWPLSSGVSALCAFKLKDIKTAFSGSYRTWNPDGYTTQTDKTFQFGKCGLPKNESRRLELVKNTFLTENEVQTVDNKMVLLSPDQTYSRVVGQQTRAADGTIYTVLFLLTESGHLHKVVLLENGPHIIEAIQVFKSAQKVKNIVLSTSSGMVFVGSSEGVSRVPVSNCHFYKTCAECVMARDPFCAWDPTKAACATWSTVANISDM